MSLPPRVLLVDDDPVLAQTLSEHLAAAGYAVTTVHTIQDALHQVQCHDLAVINDSVDGAGAMIGAGLPILVLGQALPGAAVHVAKPLRLGALIGRLGELATSSAMTIVAFGPWRLNRHNRLLEAEDGRAVRLTDKEAAILDLLASDGGVVTRDRMLAEIWGYSAAITTHTLETHIYRLRRKIEADPAASRHLVTEPGGYRLRP